ncbi:MAG: PQQ-binding-like beta-propeller repeat protein [Gemmatimonadetes bacterium]|nr:PQQ-binding-like beta-propeller repeat protein [Gemmatimonadota bacterium]
MTTTGDMHAAVSGGRSSGGGIPSAGMLLLIPAGKDYAAAAEILRQGLALEPDQIRDAATPVADDIPVIAVGNMMDNPFLHRLYLALDDVTDRAWPGPGGWALRSSLTPMSRSGPVVVVSVSDAQDAVVAAQTLVDRTLVERALMHRAVAAGEQAQKTQADAAWADTTQPDATQAASTTAPTIPYLHEVQLGRWAPLYEAAAEPFLVEPETPWEETGGAGDWDYMMLIARMGMAAVKTGAEGLVSTFVDQILRFAEVRFFERTREDPVMIHGFLRHMLIPFALLEYHPVITASQRQGVVDALLAMMRSTEGAANPRLLDDGEHHRVRQNHATRTALDVYTCGRYFHQVHDLDEAQQWMQLAHRLFESQLTSSKPVEDSWGHQWRATLYNTADYALQAGLDDYTHGPVFREAADRALLAHSNLETGPLLYLLMAAAATGDDSLLVSALRDGEDALVEGAVTDLGGDETGRSWVTGRAAVEADRLTGLHTAPLSRLFYDSVQHYDEYAPADIYTQDTPWDQSFDKIAWRSGWSAQDDYLLLDGVSGGSHAYQDANAIVRYTAGGLAWFGGPDYGKWSTASVREHCAVSVVVDGCGPGSENRYARLLHSGRIPGAHSVSTLLTYPGMAHWRRHIICAEAGWYLCVYEIEALVEGAFLVEGRWNVLGDVRRVGDRLTSRQGGVELTMRCAGNEDMLLQDVVDRDGLSCRRWVLRTASQLQVGEHLRLITVWRVSESGPEAADGESAGRAPAGGAPVVAETASATSAGGESAGADTEPADTESAPLQFEATSTGCRIEGVEVAMGDVEGLTEIDGVWWLPGASMVQAGSAEHFNVVADTPWMPVWQSDAGAEITALATGPMGIETGVVGQEDGAVRVIGAGGEDLAHWVTGGPVRDIALLPDGAIVVGGDDATIRVFEADGRLRWSHEIQWQPMSWEYWTRLHCGIVSLQVMDLGGDGEMEIVVGCADRHLYAFGPAGDLLWRTACQWGVPTSLACATGANGEALVLAGMSQPAIHGWCRVHDGAGQFLHALQRPDIVCWSIPSWMRVLHVADVNADGQDEVITGLDTNHRQLIVYRLDGEILWEADLGASVTAVTVWDGMVVAGAANGTVSAFVAADGTRRWTAFLVHAVVSIVCGKEHVLVSLCDGRVAALDEAGQITHVAEAVTTGTTHVAAVAGSATQVPVNQAPVAQVAAVPWGDGILAPVGSRVVHLASPGISP